MLLVVISNVTLTELLIQWFTESGSKPNLVEKKHFAFLFFYRKHKCQPFDSVIRSQWTVTRG